MYKRIILKYFPSLYTAHIAVFTGGVYTIYMSTQGELKKSFQMYTLEYYAAGTLANIQIEK